MKRALIRMFGCILSAIGVGTSWADTGSCTTDFDEKMTYTVYTIPAFVGWKVSDSGAFATFDTYMKNYGNRVYQFGLSGDSFKFPGGEYWYVGSNMTSYYSGCKKSWWGATLTCLYDYNSELLYSPSSGIFSTLGCEYTTNEIGSTGSTGSGTGSGSAANCYYTNAGSGSGVIKFPAYCFNFEGCDDGYYLESAVSVESVSGCAFYTVPVAGADVYEVSALDLNPDYSTDLCDRGALAEQSSSVMPGFTSYGLSSPEKSVGYISDGCQLCPKVSNVGISNYPNITSYTESDATSEGWYGITTCRKNVTNVKDSVGTFDFDGTCSYEE